MRETLGLITVGIHSRFNHLCHALHGHARLQHIRHNVERSTMADTPIIFKRNKAKHVQRARDGSPEASQQTTETNSNEPSMSVLSTKLKNKAKRGSKPKTALSFGGDREVRVTFYA